MAHDDGAGMPCFEACPSTFRIEMMVEAHHPTAS